MKRKTSKVEQKAWRYENIYPQYVSIVKTGANYIPFSTLKFSDELDQEITDGYDVQSVVFPLGFSEADAVKYLESKNFVDYKLESNEEGSLFVNSKSIFDDVKVIELPEGIKLTVGKTETASIQSKTKIEETIPLVQMNENADQEVTVVLEQETSTELDPVEDVIVTEIETVATDIVLDEVTAEAVADLVAEIVPVEQVIMSETEAVKAMLKLKFETSNDYLKSVDARKVWLVIDLLAYNLMDNICYALAEDDREIKVKSTASDFAEAVLKLYGALDTINLKANDDDDDEEFEEDDLDQTGATIIGEEEPLVYMNSNEELLALVKELKEEVTSLKLSNTVDTEKVLMQTSKADQHAYDKEDFISMEEQKPKPSLINQAQRNNFGII